MGPDEIDDDEMEDPVNMFDSDPGSDPNTISDEDISLLESAVTGDMATEPDSISVPDKDAPKTLSGKKSDSRHAVWGFPEKSKVLHHGDYKVGASVILGDDLRKSRESGLYFHGLCRVVVFRPRKYSNLEDHFQYFYRELMVNHPELTENGQYLLAAKIRHNHEDLLGIYPIECHQMGKSTELVFHSFEVNEDNQSQFRNLFRRSLIGYLNRFNDHREPGIFIQDSLVHLCKEEMDSLGVRVAKAYDLRKI